MTLRGPVIYFTGAKLSRATRMKQLNYETDRQTKAAAGCGRGAAGEERLAGSSGVQGFRGAVYVCMYVCMNE